MTADDGSRLTTDDVLAHLQRAGLVVTANMLGQDVKAGYLPPRSLDPRGPHGGIGRWWAPWVLRRALYLYRLRRRGVQGDLLRVLLFLRDGWGWERVRPICLAGLAKLIDAQRRPLRRHLRTPEPTPRTVETLSEDIAEDLDMTTAMTQFVYGLGLFGASLPGGSVEPLAKAMHGALGLEDASTQLTAVGQLLAAAGLTWDEMVAVVEAANIEQVECARRLFQHQRRIWRGQLTQHFEQQGIGGQSTNPLTLCGRIDPSTKDVLRDSPGRITAAQLLAGIFGIMIVVEEIQRRLGGSVVED